MIFIMLSHSEIIKILEVKETKCQSQHCIITEKVVTYGVINIITLIQGIYNYIPGEIGVYMLYITATVWLQRMVHVRLFPMINIL